MSESPIPIEVLCPGCRAPAVYLSGGFNDWSTGSDGVSVAAVAPGLFRGEVAWGPRPTPYKFHLGDWAHAELDEWGVRPANRFYPGDRQAIRAYVPQFLSEGSYHAERFRPRIERLPSNLPLPARFATRRIAALLPYDYDRSGRDYPVLYLQDGQNLFDEFAPYGNWELDRRLAWLSERGRGDFIVVAIDHAEEKRIAEYSPPSPTSRVGRGEADAYGRFLVRDLKPLIDRTYRTRPERAHTFLGGSSMGALASLHVVMSEAPTFAGAMLLSPSIWVDPTMVERWPDRPSEATRVYLYGGLRESDRTTATFAHLDAALRAADAPRRRVHLSTHFAPDAEHNEQAWGEVFPRAATFLFGA